MYTGDLIFGSQTVGGSVINDFKLISYPEEHVKSNGVKIDNIVETIPLSIAITQFHFLLLYKKKIKGMCQLDGKIVYEEEISLEPGERIIGMKMDAIKDSYWIYTTQSLYELLITDEDRNVWSLYLEKKMFDTAISYTKVIK